MAAQGLTSLFPMTDIAVMGIGPVLRRLPTILGHLARTTRAVLASPPDVLVVIDSPDFCHRVGARVRRANPSIPIVAYVSPTVWAWRPGRARAMARWCDHLLALLPFEPDAHRRLDGPPTTYVGHPLVERIGALRPATTRTLPPLAAPLKLVVLPGSRQGEVTRLMDDFGVAVAQFAKARSGPVTVTIPAVAHVRAVIEARAATWPIQPVLVVGDAARETEFRESDLALAASGTVTLELGLAQVPMVVAYRLDWLASRIARRIQIPAALRDVIVRTPVLPDLIARAHSIPVFIDEAATPEALARALITASTEGPALEAQRATFDRLDALMRLPEGETAGGRAAGVVCDLIGRG
jgi:lipid-A-disaccharide synthase